MASSRRLVWLEWKKFKFPDLTGFGLSDFLLVPWPAKVVLGCTAIPLQKRVGCEPNFQHTHTSVSFTCHPWVAHFSLTPQTKSKDFCQMRTFTSCSQVAVVVLLLLLSHCCCGLFALEQQRTVRDDSVMCQACRGVMGWIGQQVTSNTTAEELTKLLNSACKSVFSWWPELEQMVRFFSQKKKKIKNYWYWERANSLGHGFCTARPTILNNLFFCFFFKNCLHCGIIYSSVSKFC